MFRIGDAAVQLVIGTGPSTSAAASAGAHRSAISPEVPVVSDSETCEKRWW